MATLDADVIVVGGGVAGLASALAVGRIGLKCLVLESRLERGQIDRGDVLHSSSLTTLSSWGADDLLRASNGIRISRFSMIDSDGRSLLELDTNADARPSAEMFLLLHAEIEELLERAALRTNSVRLLRGERADSLTERDGRVVGVATSTQVLRSNLVVVASGASSPLRRQFDTGGLGEDYRCVYWNLQCSGNAPFQDRAAYVLGRQGLMIMAPLPEGQFRLGFQESGNDPRPADWASEARKRLSLLNECSITVTSAYRYPVSRFLASNLTRPGAVLVGDAAHTTHPAGAKGMNLAIRDAQVLGDLIENHGTDPQEIDRALSVYNHVRRDAVAKVLRITHGLGLAAQLRGNLMISSRNSLLRLCAHLPRVSSAILTRICWEC